MTADYCSFLHLALYDRCPLGGKTRSPPRRRDPGKGGSAFWRLAADFGRCSPAPAVTRQTADGGGTEPDGSRLGPQTAATGSTGGIGPP